MRPFHRLAQTPVRWGLRFPDGTCGGPRPATKSRGPSEQVRATYGEAARQGIRTCLGARPEPHAGSH